MADTDAPSADDLMTQTKDLHQTLSGLTANAPSPDDLLNATRAVVPAPPAAKPAQPSAGDMFSSASTGEADVPPWMKTTIPGPPSLEPAPNTEYGNVVPVARDTTTGQLRFAMPNMLRAPLLGLARGLGPDQVQMTMDPTTGQPRIALSPEAQAAGSLFANPLRFSGPNALLREPVSPMTLTKPLPVTVPELKAAIARADAAPPAAPDAAAAPPAAGSPPPTQGAPSQPATAPPAANAAFLDNSWLRQAGDTGQGYDMTKGGTAISSAAQQAIDAGGKVQLVADGGAKTVDITRVTNGTMYDAKDQPWGSASIAFDGTGREGLRITQPAAAPANPPSLVGITPAEATAYRSTAEGQKLLQNQTPGVADTTQYVPGVTPNQAELEQTVNAAREIKSLGIGNTEASQAAREAANANNVARTEYWNDTVGSPVDQYLERQARDQDIQTAAPKVFSPANVTGAFDPTPVVQRIDDIMSQPKNLENSQMQAVLPGIRARLVDENGNPRITDPEQAWGLRQDIDRMTSARMAQADPNPHYVAHELSTIGDAIDGKISDVAPGYQDMLGQYAAHSRKLDQMQVLNDAAPGLFRGPNMQMGFNDFQRFMKGVVDARSTPSTDLNPYKSITDDTMQRLWNLRDDLRRSAGAQDLAKAPGSDTAPNVIDALKQYAKLGGASVAENAISYMFPIGGPMITRGFRAALSPIMEGRTAQAQTARMQQMLYPRNQLTAPPPPNQLTTPGAP